MELPYNYFRTAVLFPNYRMPPLGAPYTPPCESLVNTTQPQWFRTQTKVFPNPANQNIRVLLPEFFGKKVSWQLFSSTGEFLMEKVFSPAQMIIDVEIAHLPVGLYFWRVQAKGSTVDSGKLVIER